jgi:hypothetical protein
LELLYIPILPSNIKIGVVYGAHFGELPCFKYLASEKSEIEDVKEAIGVVLYFNTPHKQRNRSRLQLFYLTVFTRI